MHGSTIFNQFQPFSTKTEKRLWYTYVKFFRRFVKMEEGRTGFVFYESYYKVLKALSAEECQSLLKLVCAYALYGEEPSAFPSELAEGIWACFYPSLKKCRVNSENRQKRTEKQESAQKSAANDLPKSTESSLKEREQTAEESEKQVPQKAEKTLEKKEALEKMGVICDCDPEDVDPEELKKHFTESDFLRETFKTLSKIKRHYRKIISGCYKNVRSAPQKETPKPDEYMQHNYSPEELKAALVNFDDWENEDES